MFAHVGVIVSCPPWHAGSPPPAGQTFEIADVHVSAPVRNPGMQGGLLRDGRYELQEPSTLDLIKTAYDVDAETILGGPSWLKWDRFDLAASTPSSAPPAAIKIILQALLAKRFQLVTHRDIRPLPGICSYRRQGQAELARGRRASNSGCSAESPPPTPGVIAFVAASCRMTNGGFVDSTGTWVSTSDGPRRPAAGGRCRGNQYLRLSRSNSA
jgi:uncharacterized protein (TIGR03435 family)